MIIEYKIGDRVLVRTSDDLPHTTTTGIVAVCKGKYFKLEDEPNNRWYNNDKIIQNISDFMYTKNMHNTIEILRLM